MRINLKIIVKIFKNKKIKHLNFYLKIKVKKITCKVEQEYIHLNKIRLTDQNKNHNERALLIQLNQNK